MNDVQQANDPLLSLLADDPKAVDREKLANLLRQFIVFETSSGTINFTEGFLKLASNSEKLEVILLADKARALIFPEKFVEGLSQSDLLALEAMPVGSIKSTIKKLYDSKQIKKNTIGKYYIPNYRLSEIYASYQGGSK